MPNQGPVGNTARDARWGRLALLAAIAVLVTACVAIRPVRHQAHMAHMAYASANHTAAARPSLPPAAIAETAEPPPAPNPTGSPPPAAAATAPKPRTTPAPPPPPVVASTADQFVYLPFRYNWPAVLPYKTAVPVQFVIEVKGVGSSIPMFTGLTPPIIAPTDRIAVYREMSVDLTGSEGRVTVVREKPYDEWQIVTDGANPTWRWYVTATGTEPAELVLTVRGRAKIDGQDRVQIIETYRTTRTVKTSFVDMAQIWIARLNPVWAAAVTVAGGLGGAYLWIRKNLPFGAPKA